MNGLFFQKRAGVQDGRFFRDGSGRTTGNFLKESMTSYAPGQIPSGAGADVGGAAAGGGGSMYGTGKPKAKPHAAPPLTNCVVKGASADPTTEDVILPTGFHRPTKEQPDEQEPGGERFLSSEPSEANFGVGNGIKQDGLAEAGIGMKTNRQRQFGKHAAMLGLGTCFEKKALSFDDVGNAASDAAGKIKDFAVNQGGKLKDSAAKGAGNAAGLLGQGVNAVTSSPALSLLAGGLVARGALRGAGRAARGTGRLLGIGRKAAKEEGLLARIAGGARKLVS